MAVEAFFCLMPNPLFFFIFSLVKLFACALAELSAMPLSMLLPVLPPWHVGLSSSLPLPLFPTPATAQSAQSSEQNANTDRCKIHCEMLDCKNSLFCSVQSVRSGSIFMMCLVSGFFMVSSASRERVRVPY